MTLVMSMSIIGISADYTLYYLTERMVHGAETSPWQSLSKVRNALLLALLTTVAAYLIMMLAPFPGIRQMAVFAAVGLSASCLTVIFWHPWLCRGLPVRPVPAMVLMLRWLAAWRRNKSFPSACRWRWPCSRWRVLPHCAWTMISRSFRRCRRIFWHRKSDYRADRAECRSEVVCGVRPICTANAGTAGSLYCCAGAGEKRDGLAGIALFR